MENASKVLLIAAGVLIVILIVTMGIKILSPVEGTKQSAAEVGQSLSDKTSSAISTILGLEGKIPELPEDYFEVNSGIFTLNAVGKTAIQNGEITAIKIPAKKGDIEIKKIQNNTFEGCDKIKTVYISKGITELGWDVFKNCKNITKITLPSTLAIIGTSAFFGVGKDTQGIEELKIPNGVTEIQTETFDSSNIKNIIIPDTVTIIGRSAFQKSQIERVVIEGENLVTIKSFAFDGCTNLSQINLPSSLTSIGEAAFQRCSKIKIVQDENGKYSAQPK